MVITLDVRKVSLIQPTLVMGDIFLMVTLISAYETYQAYDRYMPSEIIMTKRQLDAYLSHLEEMAEILGLDSWKRPDKITFRGVEIKCR